ncbi:polyhydroxyalkanoate depolymerase [Amaricoccus sp.]|uniref:polyhydroxyalkanoate depolymerase n=1 Tax=Amaricoccus sp. TaxID=1872485 RepID=UPI001B46A57C|nr:polyhydroxyalkanoate depolymerase [Amaricoccus sp.]MBP7002262.1 polyhydroxyalkanoate depolymerase [Amaricoccus sp.]
MLYHAYEMTHAAISPMRAAAQMGQQVIRHPLNFMPGAYGTRAVSAALEMFINATRRYGKPSFGIATTVVEGKETSVVEETVWSRPFCDLLHFRRDLAEDLSRGDPRVLIVAPMSGHYATLLRGTVEAMLPEHDVYITDWIDAREVPVTDGTFDLDDYTDYVIEMIDHLSQDGRRICVMAVCQPGIPVMAAAALMAMRGNPRRPASVVLMGSPIDTARNPKQPNELANKRTLAWFDNNVVVHVPWPNRGFMRRVYPGFLQLSSFLAMNVDRHVDAHVRQFRNLVRGDGDSSDSHRRFYDEYLAVMDLSADFYLQTIERVFQKRLMAIGEYNYRGERVYLEVVEDVALMTIEGEKDDITGLGQTEAAHDLVINLPESLRRRYVAEGVGHYGVFNGSKWRRLIQPAVAAFIRSAEFEMR